MRLLFVAVVFCIIELLSFSCDEELKIFKSKAVFIAKYWQSCFSDKESLNVTKAAAFLFGPAGFFSVEVRKKRTQQTARVRWRLSHCSCFFCPC